MLVVTPFLGIVNQVMDKTVAIFVFGEKVFLLLSSFFHSSVGVVTRLQTRQPTKCASSPYRNKKPFSSPQNIQTVSGNHSASYTMNAVGFSPLVTETWRKFDQSPPSSVDVNNGWSHTHTIIRPYITSGFAQGIIFNFVLCCFHFCIFWTFTSILANLFFILYLKIHKNYNTNNNSHPCLVRSWCLPLQLTVNNQFSYSFLVCSLLMVDAQFSLRRLWYRVNCQICVYVLLNSFTNVLRGVVCWWRRTFPW